MVLNNIPPGSGRQAAHENAAAAISRLLEIMRRLRDPESGCPWDIEQDFDSIAPYTIEEAYEVADAIQRQAWQELKSELGDLLLQTVYLAQIGSERGLFNFEDVADAIAEKMVSRHPHVFGEAQKVSSAQEQTRNWEALKASERASNKLEGTLSGLPLALPALSLALKLQDRAARVGFDWSGPEQVVGKVSEETRELEEALRGGTPAEAFEEFGDLMFTMVNLARHLGIDPEASLRAANSKFIRRFESMEKRIESAGLEIFNAPPDQMEEAWEEAKAAEVGTFG